MACSINPVVPGLLLALIGSGSAALASSMEYGWYGMSNEHGGKVQYGPPPDHPEAPEATRIDITCYAFDRGIRVVVFSAMPRDFEVGRHMIFTVDGAPSFQREAEFAYWGYFGAMPSAWLWSGDLESLMAGQGFELTLEGDTTGFSFEADLTGTRALMSRHLRACI